MDGLFPPAPWHHLARARVGGVAIHAGIRFAERLGRLHPGARPERHGVEVLKDLPYREGGHPRHRADVYRPARGSDWPVVVYFHGGAFSILSKDTHWVMGLALARRGYLAILPSYRLAPEAPYPAAIEDACAAWLWAGENAARLRGDPARLAVAGESAGGNLTLALAVAASWRREEPFARAVFESAPPKAALPFCGILQVTQPDRFRGRIPGWMYRQIDAVGRSYLRAVRDPAGCGLADPLCVLESGAEPDRPLPPVFAPVGDRDPLLDDTKRLQAALVRRGVTVEAPVYRGEGHAFHALVFRENARQCWRDAYAFLERHL